MKTKLHYYFFLSFALAFAAPKANAQKLIQYWDFNQIRPITGTGGDSLGTVFSYANTLLADSAVATWPLTANYSASTLTPGHIIYSRPTIHYSTSARDSILDGATGGSFFYDYSGNSTYFSASDSDFAEGNGFLKVRNPSDSCEMYIYIPTTGYKNVMFNFAISQSSIKGAIYNVFAYSTDGGTSWKNLTTAMDTFNIGGVYRPDTLQMTNPTTVASGWYPVQINFSSDATVNNNSGFIVKIRIAGPNSVGASGNDRYDNFAVLGTAIGSGINEVSSANGYSVYPNPANNVINVVSENYSGPKVITIYDVTGQTVSVTENNAKQTAINTASLNSGVYFVEVKELNTGIKQTFKIVQE